MLPPLTISLPFAIPSVPGGIGELPNALGASWGWALAGAALAVVALWMIRRARRMVVAAALAVAGLLIAWNAGFLPLSA